MNRPCWCPHPECQFKIHTQEMGCIGVLPIMVEHDGDLNTHRLCIHGAKDDGEWTFDLTLNKSDAYNLGRILKTIE